MSLPAASTPPANVQVVDLAKRYGTGADATTVFEQVNLEVAAGEFVAIVGDSGVGKSTLLNCLAGLDRWDQGQVLPSRRAVRPKTRALLCATFAAMLWVN